MPPRNPFSLTKAKKEKAKNKNKTKKKKKLLQKQNISNSRKLSSIKLLEKIRRRAGGQQTQRNATCSIEQNAFSTHLWKIKIKIHQRNQGIGESEEVVCACILIQPCHCQFLLHFVTFFHCCCCCCCCSIPCVCYRQQSSHSLWLCFSFRLRQ